MILEIYFKMEKKLKYPLLFIAGLFIGTIAIDIPGHIFLSRFYFHNIYLMYLVVGSAIGITFNYCSKHMGCQTSTQ